MKKLMAILFLSAALFGFWWVFGGARSSLGTYSGKMASLSVKTFPAGQVVFLGEQELGVTPLLREGLKKGSYTLKIGSLKKSIQLEEGATTSIELGAPIGAGLKKLSWGYDLSFQKLPFLGRASNLMVFVNQKGAHLFLDNQPASLDFGDQKTFTTRLAPKTYSIKVEKKGFASQVVPVEIKDNFLALLEVSLVPNLYYQQERLDLTSSIEPGKASNGLPQPIILSTQWRKNFPNLNQKLINLNSWRLLSFVKLFYDPQEWDFTQKEEVFGYLSLLDSQAQLFFDYPGVPFCYLINSAGQIYEGFGIRNFDFSGFSNLNLAPGTCLVAYLLPLGESGISAEAKNAADRLRNFLAGRITLRSKLLTDVGKVRLEPGAVRDFSLEFQNLSSMVWVKKGNEKVVLKAQSGPDLSPLYHPSWLSSEQVALPKEEFVLPGKVALFDFSIKAPFYPGLFEQKFALVHKPSGEKVIGSEITLPIEVAKEGALIVRIQKTPTGFLNVRSAPSLNADLLGVVYTQEEYLVLEKQDRWYKILLRDGKEGFIYGQYVTEI